MTELELTPEVIQQIVRAARVLAPGFSEKQLLWLIDCQNRLSEEGFCEGAWSMAQFQREKGILPASALAACKELLEEKARLEAELDRLKDRVRSRLRANKKAEEHHRQLLQDMEETAQELARLRARQEAEKEAHLAYQKQAQEEMDRIDRELEQQRRKASATQAELAAASQVKAELERMGFTLEQMLGACQDLAGNQDLRESLSRALQGQNTLRKNLEAMELRVSQLDRQRQQMEAEVNSLGETKNRLELAIARLRDDAQIEQELRAFYRRYRGVSGLLDCLANWEQVYFLRCNNPASALAGLFSASARGPRLWTNVPLVACPHCGTTALVPDEKPYHVLNWPPGTPLKLNLEG